DGVARAQIDLLVKLGDAYLFVAPEKAEALGREALDAATALDYSRGIVAAKLVLARSYQFRGSYAEDVQLLIDAYALAISEDLTDLAASSLRNMGAHYLYIGDFEHALRHLLDALPLAEKAGDIEVLASVNFSLGGVYTQIGSYPEAEAAFEKSLSQFREINLLPGEAVVYASLGELREETGDFNAATDYYTKVVSIMEEVGDLSGLAFAHASLGSVCLKLGDIDGAIEEFGKSLEYAEIIGDRDVLANGHLNLGRIHQKKGNLPAAKTALKRALDIAVEGGSIEHRMNAYKALAEIYREEEDFAAAHEHLLGFLAAREELYPADYTETLAQIQARYQAKEREAEISSLRRDNVVHELQVERGRAQRNIAFGAVFIVLVVLLALSNGYWVKTRTNRKMSRQNTRLLEVSKELERANNVKSEILANTSHEIRTPLNGILGLVTLLLDTDMDQQQKANLKSIEHSGQTLLHLVNDILDLSRIEAGKFEIDYAAFDLRGALETESQIWREQAELKTLSFSLEIDDNLPGAIVGAGPRVLQILANFVSNAIKFTETGNITVRVAAKRRGSSEVDILFEVQDTGIGVSQEFKDQAFERFSQSDTSSTRAFGGTGLGLAISRDLAKMMGGEIGVSGQEGEGSTFWFSMTADLPAAGDLPVRTARSRPGVIQSDSQNGQQSVLHVLIAEDNEINQRVIVGLVERLGHSTAVVGDGEEVLEILNHEKFDAILMDIQMPGIDGVMAAKWIRSKEGPVSKIPIVALTANAMTGDREKYLAQGMDDYLAKPIDPAALAAVLARFAGSTNGSGNGANGSNGAKAQRASAKTPQDASVSGQQQAELSATDRKALSDLVDSLSSPPRT
ncbi:MAG: tetratricopeptide repeat protein, partial [Proteobacteria bacterium]|nr:tetratricopeptide repeat protein [Pseudomonadota bacterium]